MKVLVTSRLYPNPVHPSRGTFVHNQVRFLRAYCDMEVVSPTPWFPPLPGLGRWSAYGQVKRRALLDGIEVCYPPYLSLPRRFFFASAWRRYLSALERARQSIPHLIHAHLAYPDGYAALQLGRRLGRPVVISVHGHDVRELPAANLRWRRLISEALQGADAVIASSRDIYDRVQALGTDPRKMHLIPQGVDCELFRPNFRRKAGEGGWQLLYVGRFDPRKGVGLLLEALALLRRVRSDLHLRLVGSSPMSGTARELQRQAEDLGLTHCVEFADELPWREIPGQLAAADLLILPSLYDSFGIVLIEAMACGLPVVATRCGGPEEIVTPQVGELVAVGDPVALARGISAVLDKYSQYDRAAIRRQVEEKYDYRQLAACIAKVYEEALVRGQSSR